MILRGRGGGCWVVGVSVVDPVDLVLLAVGVLVVLVADILLLALGVLLVAVFFPVGLLLDVLVFLLVGFVVSASGEGGQAAAATIGLAEAHIWVCLT